MHLRRAAISNRHARARVANVGGSSVEIAAPAPMCIVTVFAC